MNQSQFGVERNVKEGNGTERPRIAGCRKTKRKNGSWRRQVGGFYRRGITLKQAISYGHQLDAT